MHLNEEVLYIDDFVSDQRLQEDANKANEAVLHVLVRDIFTAFDAIENVVPHELRELRNI